MPRGRARRSCTREPRVGTASSSPRAAASSTSRRWGRRRVTPATAPTMQHRGSASTECRYAPTSRRGPWSEPRPDRLPAVVGRTDGDTGTRGSRRRGRSRGGHGRDAEGRGGVRGDRRRRPTGRDHPGLGERRADDAAGRRGPARGRDSLRGAGGERPPRSRPGARLLRECADAGAEGDHRRRGNVRRAAWVRRLPHRPARDRRSNRRQEPRRARRAAVRGSDAARRPGRVRGDRRREERRPARSAHNQRVIARYTREEIGAVWAQQRRMEAWLTVELAATDAWAAEGSVPADAAEACRERAAFTVEAVEERERTTGHDVAAFVDVVGDSIGPEGRWIHYGLTSSDVLDTGLAVQLAEAGTIVLGGATEYRDALIKRALEHRDTVSVGRTHGVHAEPTTFGLRLASFAFEADRNLERLRRAFEGAAVGKLSGAVGTYASVPPSVEARVMEALEIRAEPISTQVVPRDRHAELVQAVALAGAGLERFATEIRNLQRTEVREVEEPFGEGQKGSSAMPHKRNPIVSERVTGLARVLRGYAQTALENVALWH